MIRTCTWNTNTTRGVISCTIPGEDGFYTTKDICLTTLLDILRLAMKLPGCLCANRNLSSSPPYLSLLKKYQPGNQFGRGTKKSPYKNQCFKMFQGLYLRFCDFYRYLLMVFFLMILEKWNTMTRWKRWNNNIAWNGFCMTLFGMKCCLVANVYIIIYGCFQKYVCLPPKMDGVYFMQKTLFFNGMIWGVSHYFWVDTHMYIPGTQMTFIFEGQPPKTRPKLQLKQGSFRFQVYICIYIWGFQVGLRTSGVCWRVGSSQGRKPLAWAPRSGSVGVNRDWVFLMCHVYFAPWDWNICLQFTTSF